MKVEPNADGSQGLSGTLDDWCQFKSAIFRDRPYVDRISIGFTLRMAQLNEFYGEWDCVTRELDYLEGLSNHTKTKPETQFKHPPLHPLWHKHFTNAYHIKMNICSRWSVSRGGNTKLTEVISGVAREYGHDPDLWPKMLSDKLTIEALEHRSSKNELTGDWIIFGKHEGANYYLDTAEHDEDDMEVLEKVRNSSETEFPFLFAKSSGTQIGRMPAVSR